MPAARWLRACRQIALTAALVVLAAGCGRAAPGGSPAGQASGRGPGAPIPAPSLLPTESATPGLVPRAGAQPLVFSDLHMISADEGWGSAWTLDRSSGGIWRTGDGGLTWRHVTPQALDPTAIETTFFLDARHAWLVASGRSSGTGVWLTEDGGGSWTQAAPLQFTSAAPGWLDFSDAQHGWLMANLGASAGSMAVGIYRTTDGGHTWENVSMTSGDPAQSTGDSLPYACNKTGLAFANATTGWATGHCTTGGAFFYVTHDGGATWQSQPLRPPAGSPAALFDDCDCETTPPIFASGQNGVAPVKIFTTGHEAVLYVTQDGGQTWHASQLASTNLLRRPDFVTATDGWVTDEQQIYLTHDAGNTWAPAAGLPSLRLLGTLDFVDLQHGWITGGQQVYRTSNAGRTWQPLTPVPAP